MIISIALQIVQQIPGASTKVSCRLGALDEPLITAVLNKLVVEPVYRVKM